MSGIRGTYQNISAVLRRIPAAQKEDMGICAYRDIFLLAVLAVVLSVRRRNEPLRAVC